MKGPLCSRTSCTFASSCLSIDVKALCSIQSPLFPCALDEMALLNKTRKLITNLHTPRMHYTRDGNISDKPGFVLPQELCLMTAKNFELLYSFQISLHCSAVIKKHFVRVFVCYRSALTHINKAAC